MCSIGGKKAGEAKISNLRVEIVVDQDVVGFDVAVDDVDGVEVGEGGCSVDGGRETEGEGEGFGADGVVEVVGQGPVGDELVDEEEVGGVGGRGSVEGHEVRVADSGEDSDFIHELLDAFVARFVQTLHGNNASVSEKT